jgi:hypothetical protein
MDNYVIFEETNAETGEVTETKHYLTPEEIATYQAQEAQANKQKAKDLLAQTDWTTIADVSDPARSNPYLANAADFVTYRNALRAIVFNPTYDAVFPTMPTEVWSS